MTASDIQNTILGKSVSTPENYHPDLLFRLHRAENRLRYGLEDNDLPFTGFDVWNCYEVSFLTDNGLPVSRMMKLIYPAESAYIVESKSLKLYLNSFNMESFGKSAGEAEQCVAVLITKDLSRLLETEVKLAFFSADSIEKSPFILLKNKDLLNQIPVEKLETMKFSHFLETPELLKAKPSPTPCEYAFCTDLLRSNCRVTAQPDWGDLFVTMTACCEIDLLSVAAYLVSFRRENHFHEEVTEMVYKRFWDKFHPEKLMVAAMYTRRGGIDINPVRASHADLIDAAFTDSGFRLAKTLRQ